MRQSGACVSSTFPPLGIVFDPSTNDNNWPQWLYLLTILSTPQPLHPFPEHVCRRRPELLVVLSVKTTVRVIVLHVDMFSLKNKFPAWLCFACRQGPPSVKNNSAETYTLWSISFYYSRNTISGIIMACMVPYRKHSPVLRPMLMETRCCRKKFEFQIFPP